MIHDAKLLDTLAEMPTEIFNASVFRATRQYLDPLTASSYGGRWMHPGGAGVLYTSLARDGAIAELSFHWGQQKPLPTKPALLHTLSVVAKQTLRLVRADLMALGVSDTDFAAINCPRAQQIGDAVRFLEFDGLIAPSARWSCDNLMLFPDNMGTDTRLEVVRSEGIDWLSWARKNGFLDP